MHIVSCVAHQPFQPIQHSLCLNAFNFQTHSLEPVNQFVAFGHYLFESASAVL
jgi:hypothetical protein